MDFSLLTGLISRSLAPTGWQTLTETDDLFHHNGKEFFTPPKILSLYVPTTTFLCFQAVHDYHKHLAFPTSIWIFPLRLVLPCPLCQLHSSHGTWPSYTPTIQHLLRCFETCRTLLLPRTCLLHHHYYHYRIENSIGCTGHTPEWLVMNNSHPAVPHLGVPLQPLLHLSVSLHWVDVSSHFLMLTCPFLHI